MKREIDRRHYTTREPELREKLQRFAGFNLALTATERRLPRPIRRVLAGVRRPLRTLEFAALIVRDGKDAIAAARARATR